MNCSVCEISDEEKSLRKCAICFKYFCDDCGVDRSGRWFCTTNCADYFFTGTKTKMIEDGSDRRLAPPPSSHSNHPAIPDLLDREKHTLHR